MPLRTASQPTATWATGRYYFLPNGVANTSNGLGNGSLRATQFFVPNAVTVVRLGCEITVVGEAGSQIRLGIYADTDSRPGALVLDAGTVAVDVGVGAKEITLTQPLPAGYYWAAAAVQGAVTTQPTVRIVNSVPTQLTDAGTSAPTSTAAAVCWISGTSIATLGTALPNPFAASTQSTAAAARIFAKV